MTDEEFQSLLTRIESGSLLIGVDRHLARRFYAGSKISRIKEATGEAPYLHKFVVFAATIMGWWTLLASFVFAVLAFSWWAVLVIPISVGIWSIGAFPRGGMTGVTLILALALLGIVLDWFPSKYAAWAGVLVAVALWSNRYCYVAAGRFMVSLALRNRRAFEFLAPDIHLRESSSQSHV